MSDIEHVVLPFYGARLLHNAHLKRLGADVSQTAWEFGREVGHTGGADVLAGLDYLTRTSRIRPGHRVLMLGEGAGFICTAAVLEIQQLPPTAPAG
ncbi:3-oxoacyl-[acyl-carrier-protein] synthase III C-terminal domain-containing protein [Streptomyces cupreus]|uniref:3-oxoacyl-[acyl-carrier-protein] synthase III C-terminal domain-containing protein n=1 Tax=Streptomyces cupreus TaxID=2759956 RepID=UPI003AB99A57